MGTERNSGSFPRPDIICLEGNGYRESHKGNGWRHGETMYTLNTTEVHAVCVSKISGFDSYNLTLTGHIARTLASERSDPEHLPCVLVYDPRGNGNGIISPTITGDHQNRITDYTAIVVLKDE